ncbi:MAG: hypothetical protein QM754_10530 [Tepidisphaeraceae bacterium]
MIVRVTAARRVICREEIVLPLSARQAWGQLRDFHRYACHDPFHARIRINSGVPRVGAELHIDHRYGPFRARRRGRILRWREGVGFAFSDLSLANPKRGFPHILSLTVRDSGSEECRLIIRVGGKWTAPTPRWIARLWLRWVFLVVVQRTRNDLLRFALSQRVAGKTKTGRKSEAIF